MEINPKISTKTVTTRYSTSEIEADSFDKVDFTLILLSLNHPGCLLSMTLTLV